MGIYITTLPMKFPRGEIIACKYGIKILIVAEKICILPKISPDMYAKFFDAHGELPRMHLYITENFPRYVCKIFRSSWRITTNALWKN